MLNIPEDIKDLFRSDNTRAETAKNVKLRFYNENISLLFPNEYLFPSDDLFPIDMKPLLTIENNQINTESLMITESLCDSENIVFGQCNAAKVEITVADVTLDLTGKEFLLTIEVGDYELAMGIYRVESFVRKTDRRMRKITAYDRMRYFQKDVAAWYQQLTFPMTLKQFRNALCDYTGIEQAKIELPLDGMQITKTIEPQQLSGLDVLQSICEINGCFGSMEKTGKLKYVSLAISGLYPSEDLYPADDLFPAEMLNAEHLSHYRQSDTTYEDYVVYGIDKVQIRQEEGDVGAIYGNGNNGYVIQGNFLVYGKNANELLQIAATLYDQISGRMYRPAKIKCNTLPWVEVGDGIICYTTDEIIETYCFKRTIQGIQAMTDLFEATGSREQQEDFGIGTQIIQLEGKTAVIKKSVEEVSVNVSNLKEYTEAQFKITAEKIELKVSKGDVSAQLSVESDKVTISGNRLIVNSTNFQLDGNGNATFSGNVKGASITGTSISGGYIYGSTIETNIFYAGNDEVQLGDFYVSATGKNIFSSNDKSIVFQTQAGGPFGKYAVLQVTDRSASTSTIISGQGITARNISAARLFAETETWNTSPYNNNVSVILDHIWAGHTWSLETLDQRLRALERMG